jgi:hypothetical protein
MRTVAVLFALLALVVFAGTGLSADPVPGKAVKAQMVKGTIKSADPATGVLVVNQKVGNGVVDRELSITEKVEFSITNKDGTDEVFGKEALKLLVDAKGASVTVKCDKDVNVLKVTVKISK